ncbi:aminotransferase class V-fold PLP-dependent enzyme [Neolewinella aurantiaca]|uniref:Aminotransferase class V-fold PLP-dependent enzyme n=1 Tax=Neolewinella aurantiaca TaxID=2602767 RepID=A0A5C7FIX9_9BACT|nr:aminotransferase class V-fold PLP-dependent enzyme [Neolewinella aurantiaca]TXF89821.1 aminotransferase class V-fold PLP-dependent enzyme [Neolewinella aurantiaca]
MTQLTNQRFLFPEKAVSGYLNGASRSPQLKALAAAARHAIWWREENAGMPIPAFFETVSLVKAEFAQLINCAEPDRIAVLPSTSYGIATAAKNLPLQQGQNIIVAEDQFPSNYYSWLERCKEVGAELRVVARPEPGATDSWSDRVLAAIDHKTAAVAIAQVHWADGSLFDLAAIRDRTNDVDAWLIIDATQSVGAFPTDVSALKPDVLCAGGYKWLMGPYGCGYAYFGERMDGGTPLEENWINRAGSEDFRNLVNYREEYRPLAGRYCVGQQSNFIMMPMQLEGLKQVNAWGAENIQAYCNELWSGVAPILANVGIELPEERAHHLVGLKLTDDFDRDVLSAEFERRGLSLSYRGDAIRVSPGCYNLPEELAELAGAFFKAVK